MTIEPASEAAEALIAAATKAASSLVWSRMDPARRAAWDRGEYEARYRGILVGLWTNVNDPAFAVTAHLNERLFADHVAELLSSTEQPEC